MLSKMLLPALLYALLAMIGIPLNFSVCFITYKYRREYSTLRSNTGILLAANSFFEILHQCSHFCFLAVSVSGELITLRTALYLEGIPILGLNACILSMLGLSFDRLFTVAAPLLYRRMNNRFYLLIHFALICCYLIRQFHYCMKEIVANPEKLVNGFIVDLVNPGDFPIVFCLYSLTFLFYLIVAVLVKLKTAESAPAVLQHLYRSLALIVCINVGGYLFTGIVYLLFQFGFGPFFKVQLEPIYLELFSKYSGLLLNLAAFSNGPILFVNSKEYREAYKREWLSIEQMFCAIFSVKQPNNTIVVPAISVHALTAVLSHFLLDFWLPRHHQRPSVFAMRRRHRRQRQLCCCRLFPGHFFLDLSPRHSLTSSFCTLLILHLKFHCCPAVVSKSQMSTFPSNKTTKPASSMPRPPHPLAPIESSQMANIFQMDRIELQQLHGLLWANRQQNVPAQLSARTLRVRATEWLLLNGLSTLHRFKRRKEVDEENNKMVSSAESWAFPGKNDGENCNTCRQYSVGKEIPIYKLLAKTRAEPRRKFPQNGRVQTAYSTDVAGVSINLAEPQQSMAFEHHPKELASNGVEKSSAQNGGPLQGREEGTKRRIRSTSTLFDCFRCRKH